MIDQWLLEHLVCPLCKEDVELKDDRLICVKCGRRYPVRDGIPIMLVEEAELPEGSSEQSGGQGSEAEGRE